MRDIDLSKMTELYAANDNGGPVLVIEQPEPTPEQRGKKVGFGFDKALDSVVKSLPFEKEMIASLLFDEKRMRFHGINAPDPEQLMQRMQDSIFETNLMRLMGQQPVFEPSPDHEYSDDPMDYLGEADRADVEVLRKLSMKERQDFAEDGYRIR